MLAFRRLVLVALFASACTSNRTTASHHGSGHAAPQDGGLDASDDGGRGAPGWSYLCDGSVDYRAGQDALVSTDLHEANLSCEILRCSVLRNADLTGVNLNGAAVSYVNFTGADLTGADLRGASFVATTAENLRGCPASLPNDSWQCVPQGNDRHALVGPQGWPPVGDIYSIAELSEPGRNIAVDAANVYVVLNGANGGIVKVPKDGSAPTVLARAAQPASIALDAANVYWGAGYAGGGAANGVFTVPKAGGTPTMLYSGPATQIAVDAKNVYWTDIFEQAIMKMPTAGGTVTTLVTGEFNLGAIVVDAKNLYWTANGMVRRMLLTGSEPITLAIDNDSHSGPMTLAVDTTDVYWTSGSNGGGTVRKVPIAGGTPTTLVSPGVGAETGDALVLDATNVYWLEGNQGGPWSAPRNGGAPKILHTPCWPDVELGLAVDDTGLYWMSAKSVMRLAFD
jgi:uncharacterized protein YjbI with pentapeptide repeats